MGKLSEHDLEFVPDQHVRDYLKKNEAQFNLNEELPPQQVWQKRYPHANPVAIDLMAKLLSFNPRSRLTVYEAIQHEYFAQIIALETPPTSQVKFKWDWEYKNTKLLNQIPVVKKLIYMESLKFHPDEVAPAAPLNPTNSEVIHSRSETMVRDQAESAAASVSAVDEERKD